MKSRRGQYGKTIKTLTVCLFCNLLHLLATVKVQTQAVFNKINGRKRKEKEEKNSSKASSVSKESSFLSYGIILPPHILPMLLQNYIAAFPNFIVS